MATIPQPPGIPNIGEITTDTIHVGFEWGYDGGPDLGGAPILESEIWYSDYPWQAKWHVSGNNAFIGGLYSGVRYFFWGKYRNQAGWSDLGARAEAYTLRVPDAPNPVQLRNVLPTSLDTTFDYADKWDGGTPIREWQITYGTDPNIGMVVLGGVDLHINNLKPGQQYYFWARGRNDVGWGPWSIRQTIVLPAGALVDVGGEYKRAVPWVKVNGVWRLSLPLVNSGGTWRKTS